MAKVLTSLALLSSTTHAFVARPISSRNAIASYSSLKMSEIEVVSQPDKDFLEKKGVFNWGTWGCGVSKFPWTYDQNESCYLLAGKVTVTPDDKSLKPATFGKGDFVTFPRRHELHLGRERNRRKAFHVLLNWVASWN